MQECAANKNNHLHHMQALLRLFLIWLARQTSHHCHLQLSYVLLKGITAKHHAKDSCGVHKLLICQACFAVLVIPAAQIKTCNLKRVVMQHGIDRRQNFVVQQLDRLSWISLDSLCRVAQDLIRLPKLLEPRGCIGIVRVFIWVYLQDTSREVTPVC